VRFAQLDYIANFLPENAPTILTNVQSDGIEHFGVS
jgi:hypothetical protein